MIKPTYRQTNASAFNLFIYCLFALLIAGCDLFTGPKVDLFQQISDEVDWANAPKLTVRIDYPSAWGISNPPQGSITPARDIRKDYEFSVEFTPEMAFTLVSWQVFRTSDLDSLGNWLANLALINPKDIQPLGPGEVTLPAPNASGGTFNFTIHTTEPVTLVPWCDTQPRITGTEPRNRPDGPPYSNASDIVLYFNCALNAGTVKFAETENSDGIWITAKSLSSGTIITNKEKNWFYEPEYADDGGFFTVTINPKVNNRPPDDSLITVTVKGISNVQGEPMDASRYSFSWNTSATNVFFNSWKAEYTYKENDNSGSIVVSWTEEGADNVVIYYRLNGGANTHLTLSETDKVTISNVSGPDASGVKEGRSVSGIREYVIIAELYAGGIMESRASFKIWNIPGMSVSDTNPITEIRTEAGLAAIKDGLGGQYALANDISVTGAWTPLGANTSPFTGKFYGNGHKITFNGGGGIGGAADNRGLFGYAQGSSASQAAVICDLTFEYNSSASINVSAGNSNFNIGGVAGYLKNTTVSNVITSGGPFNVNAVATGNVNLGGIAGCIDESTINNCRAGMNIKLQSNGGADGLNVGGVTGNAINSNMEACSFTGEVIGKVNDSNENTWLRLGGLIGHYITNSGEVHINNCLVRGNINGEVDGGEAGGINVGGVLGLSAYEGGEVYINDSFFEGGNLKATCYSGESINAGGFCASFYEEGFDADQANPHPQYVYINNCGVLAGNVEISVKEFGQYINVGGFTSAVSLSGGISNCFSRADVKSTGSGNRGPKDYYTHETGGFAGFVAPGSTLKSCYATGNVEAAHNGDRESLNVGGLVGGSGGTIENCYALGDVLADKVGGTGDVNAGGLVGSSYGGGITYSFSAGQVTAQSKESSAYAGGVVGFVWDSYVKNTAALGEKITSAAVTPSAGRIVGTGSGLSNNYAIDTMLTGTGAYNASITGSLPGTGDVSTSHGAATTITNFLSATWWKETLKFNSNSSSEWDFSTPAVHRGYPLLKGLTGQQ